MISEWRGGRGGGKVIVVIVIERGSDEWKEGIEGDVLVVRVIPH